MRLISALIRTFLGAYTAEDLNDRIDRIVHTDGACLAEVCRHGVDLHQNVFRHYPALNRYRRTTRISQRRLRFLGVLAGTFELLTVKIVQRLHSF